MSRIAVVLAFLGLIFSTSAAQAAWTCGLPSQTTVAAEDGKQKPEAETESESEEEDDEEPDCE